MRKHLGLSLLLLALPCAVVQAATLNLQWDANSESDLSGYRLFQSTRSLMGMTTVQALGDSTITKTPLGSTTTASISITENATYYFTLTAFNTSSQESSFSNEVSTFVKDTTVPAVSMTAPANGATVSGSAVTVSATASDNISVVGVQFKVDGSNIGVEDTSSPFSIVWNSTSTANGSHSLSATARDAAGNTATSAVTVTVNNSSDVTPPVISGITTPMIGSSSATITWTTNEASDSQVDYGLTTAVSSSSALNTSTVTAHTLTLSGLTANTTYFYRVKSRDIAGNLAISSTSTFKTLSAPDITSPAVSMTAPANGATVSGSAVTVSATASDNISVVGVQFKVDGSNIGAEDTSSPYSIVWSSTMTANGSHVLSATARDAAGNTAISSVTVTVSNDSTAPTVSMTAPANGATVSGSAVTVSATASDNISVVGVQFKVDGSNIGAEDTSSPYSIVWSSTMTANGSHVLSATARDAAGNTAISSVTVTVSNDSTAPTVSMTAPANGATVSGSAVTVSATASDNISVVGVQFKVDGSNIGVEDTSSPYSIVWSSTMTANGSHVLSATARDASGNSTTAAGVAVTVSNTSADVTPPVISAVSASPIYVSSSTINWTTNESADSQVDYGLTNSLGTSSSINPSLVMSHSLGLTGLVANTTYYYHVKSRDAAGNLAISSTSTFKTLVAPDITAPTVLLTAPANGATVSGSTVTVSATASDNISVVGVQFKLDGVNLGAEDASSPYSITWNSTSTVNGAHVLSATARDSAGNTDVSSANVTVNNDLTPPTISGISVGVNITSATLSWTTNEASDSQVSYGPTTAMSLSSALNTNLVITHVVSLSGLSAGTTYYYRVKSRDMAGNLSQSGGTLQFVTATNSGTVNQAPVVYLTITQNSPFVLGAILTLSATATDYDGTIAAVRFYLGGAQIGIKTSAPYSLDYAPPFSGTYEFSAIAFDNQGAQSASSVFQATVVQPLPAPVLRLPRFVKPKDIIKVDYPDGMNINHFEWRFVRINTAAPSVAPNAAASQAINTPGSSLDLSTLQLTAGDYEIFVRAVNNSGSNSPEVSAIITLSPGTFDNVKVYPNPWRIDQHAGQPITFANLPLTATIKIFTNSGKWVKTLTAVNGTATWDLKNDAEDKVASDLYIYLASDDQTKPTRGKFVIIK